MKASSKKLSKEELERAKTLYFSGMSISKIALELDCNRTTLQYYVAKEWRQEADLRSAELLSKVSNSHVSTIASMTKNAILSVDRAMAHMVNRDAPPSTKEALDMVTILERLQKISDAYKKDDVEEIDEDDYVDPFSVEAPSEETN